MGPDGEPDALSDAERRLVELLELLAGEPRAVVSSQRTARLLRRARLQRDIRPALVVSAGLAATMLEGLAPLFVRHGTGAGG